MTTTSDPACSPVEVTAIGEDIANDLAEMLKSLSDPLRLRMLSAIATDPRGEACVCDLTDLADVSQPTISHHLKKLKDAGLLQSERRGTWVYYRVAPERRVAVASLLDTFAASMISYGPEERAERVETLRRMDARVESLAQELVESFDQLNPEFVTTMVRESYADLVRSARFTQHLIPLTERFARQRFTDYTRDHHADLPQVLFVCVANAGRSQLAAALVNKLGEGKVVARSAGSSPAAEVHPHVRSLLVEIEGEELAGKAFPKPLTDDAVRAADVVVTMGCGDVCPVIPGVNYEDWPLGDPALASEEGVRAIRDDIEGRVRDLIASLTSTN